MPFEGGKEISDNLFVSLMDIDLHRFFLSVSFLNFSIVNYLGFQSYWKINDTFKRQ